MLFDTLPEYITSLYSHSITNAIVSSKVIVLPNQRIVDIILQVEIPSLLVQEDVVVPL